MKLKLAFLALLAFAGVVLALNLFEKDRYEFGSLTPPAPGRNVDPQDTHRLILPSPFVHSCRACGECTHPIEIVEDRRVLGLHDHDGWYKLLWAADEDYYFDDPVYLLRAMETHRTAGPARGTWTIRAVLGTAVHGAVAPHDCGVAPTEVRLEYALVVSPQPLAETAEAEASPLRVPRAFPWLTYNTGEPVSMGWRLAAPPRIAASPCGCGAAP